MKREALMLDIGGVIMKQLRPKVPKESPEFVAKYLSRMPYEGAFEGIAALNKSERYRDRVFIVTKRGQRTRRLLSQWFGMHAFYGQTGLDPSKVHFCLERPEKAGICASLGVTRAVDNRFDVLRVLADVPHRYRFGFSEEEPETYADIVGSIPQIESWPALVETLLA